METVVVVLIVAVVVVAFYAALRAYSRRRIAHGDKPADID